MRDVRWDGLRRCAKPVRRPVCPGPRGTSSASLRKLDPPVRQDLETGVPRDLPGEAVGVGEVAGVAPQDTSCAGLRIVAPAVCAWASVVSTSALVRTLCARQVLENP